MPSRREVGSARTCRVMKGNAEQFALHPTRAFHGASDDAEPRRREGELPRRRVAHRGAGKTRSPVRSSAMYPPSVDRLARSLADEPGLGDLAHAQLVEVARHAVAEAIAADAPESALDFARLRAQYLVRSFLRPVVNATGVLLHTNLGRAPVIADGRARSSSGTTRYANVEFDLENGRRGSRRVHAEEALIKLTGAQAALVVNNCAAAVMLVLAAHARGREVIVSRGELVEIGGGFRIPEVLEQSGARLVEVGTTNRTKLSDYHAALARPAADVAMVLQVHRSNYRIIGFTEDVPVPALASLGVPVVCDIGSGLLDTTTPWLADRSGHVTPLPWLTGEPAARQTLEHGAALAVFSGDKLLGGPQAGIIVGTRTMVDACARHPLTRALRPGTIVLDALQKTLHAYLRADGRAIPFWRMATAEVPVLVGRAGSIRARMSEAGSKVEAVAMDAVPGGGTLPERTIASFGLRVATDIARPLRHCTPPIITRVQGGATWIDLRTVDPADDAHVAESLTRVLGSANATQGTSHATPFLGPDGHAKPFQVSTGGAKVGPILMRPSGPTAGDATRPEDFEYDHHDADADADDAECALAGDDESATEYDNSDASSQYGNGNSAADHGPGLGKGATEQGPGLGNADHARTDTRATRADDDPARSDYDVARTDDDGRA